MSSCGTLRFIGCVTAAFALLGVGVAKADTVVSVDGTGTPYYSFSGGTQLWSFGVASWSQTGSYHNVDISATLNEICCGGAGVSGVAYLLDAIGPAATAANEIAANPFSFPTVHSFTSVPLFSGLSLGPGTYHLFIAGNSILWQAGASPSVVTGADVSRLADQTASYMCVFLPCTPPPAYYPASAFSVNDRGLAYSVTGDAAVPEPASCVLVATALAAVFLRRRSIESYCRS